jgi:uncharacterized protein YaeQ
MALTATIYNFNIDLTNMDQGLYVTLDLRVAQQPSETPEYMLTRVLAYCLEYAEGIAFSPGISAGSEPALAIHDMTGHMTAWIEVGSPDADRLHRASKSADRVAVYTLHSFALLKHQLGNTRIHRAQEIPIYAIDRLLLDPLVASIERRMAMTIVVTEGQLYIQAGGQSLSGAIIEHRLA